MTRHNITKPDFLRHNIDNLSTFRQAKKLTVQELSSATCINYRLVKCYELGYQLPIKENYNKLAEFFGWQKWEAQS